MQLAHTMLRGIYIYIYIYTQTPSQVGQVLPHSPSVRVTVKVSLNLEVTHMVVVDTGSANGF